MNRYAYVSGNPISSVDPSGTAQEDQTPRFGAPGLVTTGHGGLKPQVLATDAEEEVNFTSDDQKPANDLLAVPNGGPKDFVAKGRRNKKRADAATGAIGANRDALATASFKGVAVLFIAGGSGGATAAALSAAGGGLIVIGAGSGAVEEGVRRGGLAFIDGAEE